MTVDLGMRWLVWGYRKLGPRTILYFVLLVGIMTSVILGLSGAVTGLDEGAAWLWSFSVLGVVTGWWLGSKKISLWLGAVISFAVGIVLLIFHSGGLLPHFWSLSRAAILVAWMQVLENSVSHSAISALAVIWQELLNAASAILSPLRTWIITLGRGQWEYNQTAVIFAWSMLIWLLAVWGSWGIRRYEKPMLAALPAGVILGSSLAYVGGDAKVLILFVGCVLLLFSVTSHSSRERRWGALLLPFSEELRFDVGGWSLFITLSLMLAALILPNLSIRNLINWFESRGGRTSQSEGLIDPIPFGDSLGLVADPAPIPSSMFDSVRSPGLPRKHLLGSGPELGEQVVMLVSVEDTLPHETARYYWKSLTYDVYNGQGWETGDTREIRYSQGESAYSVASDNHRVIRQTVSASEQLGGLAYASGAIVTMNRDFTVAWRDSGDELLDQFGAMQEETRYQVDSALATYSASQLRGGDGTIPDWIRSRYLPLPPGIPDRVIQLANSLVEPQSDPYESALAIERYVRTYPYNLNIDLPPPDRDVVDYFLYDLGQGYCDYYATAMVVLARAVDLPARLAVGYASGLYDQANQRYIVTAADAHSWVEVYFPGFGWIPFEPTASQPELDREGALPEIPEDLDGGLSPIPTKWSRFIRLGGIILGGSGTILVIGIFIWWKAGMWLLSRRPPECAITDIFRHIYRFGDRFGLKTGYQLTPYEFTALFNERLASKFSMTGRGQAPKSLSGGLQRMTDIYVKSIYGPEVPDTRVREEAVRIWGILRMQFWSLWLRSRLARFIPSLISAYGSRFSLRRMG